MSDFVKQNDLPERENEREKEGKEEEALYIIENWKDEWLDTVPIPQQDPTVPIAAIAYDEDFKEVMNYLRAALLLGISRLAI